MQFLAPLFFAGLAALAVPVIVHLIQRERKEPIAFPSLMFISQVPYKSTRRRKIRNWMLFALRCLALVLLVAAFARPFLPTDAVAAGDLDAAREVVVLVDRSFSMGYGDRWERAQEAARAAIDQVGPNDRATIVLFDEGAVAANQPTSDRIRLRAAVDSARIGSAATSYAPALKLAQSLLAASDLPRREVVLISDFQRSGWDGEGGVRLPAGTTFRPVPITDDAPANVTVASVTFKRETVAGRERLTATARLTSKGGAGPVRLPVTLALDDRDIETKQVELEGNGAAAVDFAPFTLPERPVRGTVRAGEDALPADNAFHFVVAANQAIRVLVVEGGGQASSLYVSRALEIGERPSYRVTVVPAARLRASDLDGQSVVVLNDAAVPSGEIGRRLREMVANGGGLLVAIGERLGRGGWPDAADFVPGTPEPLTDRAGTGGAALGYIDFSHPVFELFRAPRSGDFTGARFYRYHGLRLGQDSISAVIARFDDGRPALVERDAGRGKVLVWGSSLDTYWNDLPLQPVFLPFIHRLVAHSAGYAEPDPWFRVGQVVDVRDPGRAEAVEDSATAGGAGGGGLNVRSPSGARLAASDAGLLRLEEQGIYEIRNEAGGAPAPRWVAANLDVAESDLAAMEVQELASAVEPVGDGTGGRTGTLSVAERERRQSLWWYILVGAFLILAAETAVANRLSARRRPAES